MKIQRSVYDKLLIHAKKEAPIEACGYLAGSNEILTEIFSLTNIDKSSEHFSFHPKEQFAALKTARDQNLKILAVYHSHPESPARPSVEDIRLAYDAGKIYIIVSLWQGKETIKGFWIKEGLATPEPLEVIDG